MIKQLTKLSNQNINNIFENYPHLLHHTMNTHFIKRMYQLIKSYQYKKEEFTLTTDIPTATGTFMSPRISSFINSHSFINYTTRFLMNDTNIHLSIHSIQPINIQNYLFYIKLVLHICLQSSSKKHTEIHFKIILTDIEKTCPTIPVEMDHINSGETDPNQNKVMIFRKEEWFKVYIHECIHLFELDFCNEHINYQRLFKPLFKMKSEFLFFEAYTEFWARTINISILSYYTVHRIKPADFERIVMINLQVERLFCIAQMNHLLNRMGLTYESLNRSTMRENTSFFCYYVLTSVLFYNYNDTMDWFVKNNINILQFSKKNVYLFFEFIKQRYRAPDFLAFIKQLDQPLHNCNMSAFDILF